MPTPSPHITFTRDRVLWFAQYFIEHKKLRHRIDNVLEFPKAKAS